MKGYTMKDIVKHYEHVTRTAIKVSKGWTCTDILNFHYFNPNGLCAVKKALQDRLNIAVSEGKANTGSLLAYGSLNDYVNENLRKLLQKKRVNRRHLFVDLEMLQEEIETLENFLNEIGG
jgi:hypothetical protein